MVKYLNALPFYLHIIDNHRLTLDHPALLNRQLKEGKLECALTSSVEYFSGHYDFLPFGIAAKGKVMSVNLYLSKALEKSRIALSPFSATSNLLLKILCQHFWRVKPTFVDFNEEHDGYLLIGDEALNEPKEMIDLSEAWFEMTKLPFVFALFLTKKDFPKKKELEFNIEQSLTWSEHNKEKLIEKAAMLSNCSHDLLKSYYNCLIYRLGEAEFKGLKLFGELVHKMNSSLRS